MASNGIDIQLKPGAEKLCAQTEDGTIKLLPPAEQLVFCFDRARPELRHEMTEDSEPFQGEITEFTISGKPEKNYHYFHNVKLAGYGDSHIGDLVDKTKPVVAQTIVEPIGDNGHMTFGRVVKGVTDKIAREYGKFSKELFYTQAYGGNIKKLAQQQISAKKEPIKKKPGAVTPFMCEFSIPDYEMLSDEQKVDMFELACIDKAKALLGALYDAGYVKIDEEYDELKMSTRYRLTIYAAKPPEA